MPRVTDYPSLEEVEQADIVQLCYWSRFLSSPGSEATHEGSDNFNTVLEKESAILNRIIERQKELGGWTPTISKLIGWD